MRIQSTILLAVLVFTTILEAKVPALGDRTPSEIVGYQRRIVKLLDDQMYSFSVFCNEQECILALNKFIDNSDTSKPQSTIIALAIFAAPKKGESIVEGLGCNRKGVPVMRKDIFGVYSLRPEISLQPYFSHVITAYELDTRNALIKPLKPESIWCQNPWFESDEN